MSQLRKRTNMFIIRLNLPASIYPTRTHIEIGNFTETRAHFKDSKPRYTVCSSVPYFTSFLIPATLEHRQKPQRVQSVKPNLQGEHGRRQLLSKWCDIIRGTLTQCACQGYHTPSHSRRGKVQIQEFAQITTDSNARKIADVHPNPRLLNVCWNKEAHTLLYNTAHQHSCYTHVLHMSRQSYPPPHPKGGEEHIQTLAQLATDSNALRIPVIVRHAPESPTCTAGDRASSTAR